VTGAAPPPIHQGRRIAADSTAASRRSTLNKIDRSAFDLAIDRGAALRSAAEEPPIWMTEYGFLFD